jgi:hypothetical protein
MTRTRSLLCTAVVAVLVVLSVGGPALGQGRGGDAPLTSGAPAAPVEAAAPSSGCGKAPTLTNGTHALQSGGKNRNFILRCGRVVRSPW